MDFSEKSRLNLLLIFNLINFFTIYIFLIIPQTYVKMAIIFYYLLLLFLNLTRRNKFYCRIRLDLSFFLFLICVMLSYKNILALNFFPLLVTIHLGFYILYGSTSRERFNFVELILEMIYIIILYSFRSYYDISFILLLLIINTIITLIAKYSNKTKKIKKTIAFISIIIALNKITVFGTKILFVCFVLLIILNFKLLNIKFSNNNSVSIYVLHTGVGGVERYIQQLADTLSEKYSVRVISTFKVENSTYLNPKRASTKFLLETYPPTNFEHFEGSMVSFMLLKVNMILIRYYYNILSILFDESGILVSTRVFHNKLISFFSRSSVRKVATEHNYHNNNKRYYNSVIRSVNGFDYLLPISQELYNFYFDKLHYSNTKVGYVYFSINNKLTIRTFMKERNPKIDRLIWIGRFSYEKNPFLAVKSISKIISNNEVNLTMVGDGNEFSKIVSYTKNNNMENSIIFKGYLSQQEVYNHLMKNDYLLVTSDTESYGIVILEALECGVLPIVRDTATGSVEILKNIGLHDFVFCTEDFLNGEWYEKVIKHEKELNYSKVVELYNSKYTISNFNKGIYEIFEEMEANYE